MDARQEKALCALLKSETITEASTISGVPLLTLYRWLNDAEFRKVYQSAKRLVVEKAIAEMHKATDEAVAALRRNLKCGIPNAEIRAAQVILEQSLKAIELNRTIKEWYT